ncbi:hypothetical protein [Burkholderia sp. PAMC 28687]
MTALMWAVVARSPESVVAILNRARAAHLQRCATAGGRPRFRGR